MAGYIFTNSEAKMVADTVKANEGEVQRRLPPRPKKYVSPGGGGGSGSTTIIFQITDTCPFLGDAVTECDCVEATVTEAPCGSSVEEGDEIRVWDPIRSYFNLPAELLIGLYGAASEMKNNPYGAVDCEEDLTAEGSCRWVVISLACAEEEYGG